MFFYLHFGRGFSYLYGGWAEIIVTVCPLCDSETRSVDAQRDITLHTLRPHRVTPRSEHTRYRLLVRLRPDQCLLWRVS